MIRRALAIVVVLLFLPAPLPAADVDVDDLRPGLVATYRDAARREVVRLEPVIALALKAGETPHPRLTVTGDTIRWEGYVNVLRPAPYRFSAMLAGRFRLMVAGKEVLSGEMEDNTPAYKEGPETRLEAGVHPLVAEYTRLEASARVELFWQARHFRTEPIPYNYLGHLPAKLPASLTVHQQLERGRFLAEENNCTSCHQPADNDRVARRLGSRKAPDLSQVGQRVFASWLYEWLGSPQKVRPGAAMPQLFRGDEAGRTERYAVTRYLVSLGGPLKPEARPAKPKSFAKNIAHGQQLFISVGCVACHTSPEASRERKRPEAAPEDPRPLRSLTLPARQWDIAHLGAKTTPDKLAAYLVNPLAIDPSGRMPNMLLQASEAQDIARYLCQPRGPSPIPELPVEPTTDQMTAAFRRVDSRPEELKDFQRLPADQQWIDLGKRLVIDRGCNNCHTIAPGGKPFANQLASASFDDLKQRDKHSAGCLADDPGRRGLAPAFDLDPADRDALRAFLREGTKGAGSLAPAYTARMTLQRFNCLACHARDGEGGISAALAQELRRFEKVEDAESLTPPPLTGVSHKLRTPWLRQVLTQGGRARPWMGLRMPQFGDANVGQLPDTLAALEGTTPDDSIHKVPLTAAKLEVGRHLVGKQAFGCIACHDIAGNAASGTRGPDLALMNQRVRYDWYCRWLEEAQRMQPGTRMPTVFPEGKALLTDILGGGADAQAEAMWAYLSLGPTLPLPVGLEPPKGLILTVKDRPIVLRTFMPEAGSRAIAVGYPNGISAVFDAATCRLTYAWTGSFLDASPVWANRGGAPAKVLGARFWTAPIGCAWAVNDSNDAPDFAVQARDPAFGAALAEGNVFNGKPRLHFVGYSTDAKGLPTFRYQLDGVDVQERPEPLRSTVAPGVGRRFCMTIPAHQTAWLRAGETTRTPRLLDARGSVLPLDLSAQQVELSGNGRIMVLPQDGDRVVALSLVTAPTGATWYLRKYGSTWQALLRLPASPRPGTAEVGLNVWVPYRDDPALWKDLLSSK